MDRQEHKVERRLTSIFAADVAGYSHLMSEDEDATLQSLTAHREIMVRLIVEHGARIANTLETAFRLSSPSLMPLPPQVSEGDFR
jgi:adenylate cyclase